MIGGWRWTAHARRRHYFQGDEQTAVTRTATSLCGKYTSILNGMEQQDPGRDDCRTCSRELTKGDRTLLP